MGMIEMVLSVLFGQRRNVVKDTLEVFRENAEAAGMRDAAFQVAALEQFAAEFARPGRGRYDRFIDGLNRVPRPALAFGTLGLSISAMWDPVWFAARMQGVALAPEPLWWLLGAIVSFYFGARYQLKSQDFQQKIAATLLRTTDVMQNIRALGEWDVSADVSADDSGGFSGDSSGDNPALNDWRSEHDQ